MIAFHVECLAWVSCYLKDFCTGSLITQDSAYVIKVSCLQEELVSHEPCVGGVTLQIIVKYPSENFHLSDNFDVPAANWSRVLKQILLIDDLMKRTGFIYLERCFAWLGVHQLLWKEYQYIYFKK